MGLYFFVRISADLHTCLSKDTEGVGRLLKMSRAHDLCHIWIKSTSSSARSCHGYSTYILCVCFTHMWRDLFKCDTTHSMQTHSRSNTYVRPCQLILHFSLVLMSHVVMSHHTQISQVKHPQHDLFSSDSLEYGMFSIGTVALYRVCSTGLR